MKKNSISIIILLFLLIWGTSCDDDSSANLTLESDIMEISHEGGIYNIAVKSKESSKAVISYDTADESDWIFMIPSFLWGDGFLEIRVDPYANIWNDRIATVTITSKNETKTVTITQLAKPSVNLNPKSISTMKEANAFTVSVDSKASWKASVNAEAASWCKLTEASGEGGSREDFIVNVEAMPSGSIRKAQITIETGDLTEVMTVYQGEGVEINGLIWAHCNVGEPNNFAPSIDSRGLLYQYDSKIGYPNSSPNVSDAPAGYRTGWFELDKTWSQENNPCPPGWRIPNNDEIQALLNKGYAWIEPDKSGMAIPGAVVGIPASEVALVTKSNTRGGIFWPQAGFRNNENGKQEHWWEACITSITRPGQNWDRYTYLIDYTSTLYIDGYTPNAKAFPVRCVKNAE